MLIGLVGAPNVGKSTFFKAATLAEVLIADYPFATIKANHGIGYVRVDCIDKELLGESGKCNPREGFCLDGRRFVPIEMIDVAGLVPGASEGKGLGNKFLDDLRQADVFILVVDISGMTNEEGKLVSRGENFYPGKTILFLERELDLWYFNILKKVWRIFSRTAEIQKQDFAEAVARQFSGLKVNEENVKKVLLNSDFNVEHPSDWNDEEVLEFAKKLRKVTKPMIIAANKIDAGQGQKNFERIKKDFPDYLIIPCSAESELALREAAKEGLINYIPGEDDFKILDKNKLTDKQKQALDFIKEHVLGEYKSTGVQRVLDGAVFNLLKYVAVFPAGTNKLADSKGNILPDCFLVRQGSTVLDFAAKLHTDFAKNFIKAIDVKTKQIVSKDYELKHRDAIEIVSR